MVVYRPDVGDNIIKRAVAFGGDRVQFIEGWLYINGERQEEKYISDEYRTAANNQYYNYPANGEQHTVEKGKVFLLGDNRNHSDDSRRYGDYDLQNVLGVVPAWLAAPCTVTSRPQIPCTPVTTPICTLS